MGPNPSDFLPPRPALPTLRTPSARSEFAASLEAILRSQGSNQDIRDAILRATIRHGIGDPSDIITAWNIARNIQRQIAAGNRVADTPRGTVPLGELPRDASLPPGDPRIHYQVLVTVTTPAGLSRAATVTVTSDVPLSQAEIHAFAMQADTLTRQGRDYIVRIQGSSPESVLEAQVIGAARRD